MGITTKIYIISFRYMSSHINFSLLHNTRTFESVNPQSAALGYVSNLSCPFCHKNALQK